MSKPIRIAVLFGGRSGEHEVSLASARSIMKALDPKLYEVLPVGITREGQWLGGEKSMQELIALAEQKYLQSDLALHQRLPSEAIIAHADVVFPVLHGPFGEDGTIQGLLEIAGLPYVGSGVTGSAVGMDKILMKAVFVNAGLPVLPYLGLTRHKWQQKPDSVLQRIESSLAYPIFVKPANLGSSVGISKARTRDELEEALNFAALYDRRLIVEQGLERPREIELSVLGNDQPLVSIAGEIVPDEKYEFYDYESKYTAAQADLLIPAPLSKEQELTVQEMAIQAFQAVDAAGLSRVDFLMDRDSKLFYINELNTMPGFTMTSMYPKLWEASGLPYSELLQKLIELAFERHQEQNRRKDK
jgi:D-alanine-D-alanine ligase